MKTVKLPSIVLATHPRLLRELLQRTIHASCPNINVISICDGGLNNLSGIEWEQTGWLVVTLTPQGHIPLQVYTLLAQYPALSVLALSIDGSRAEIQMLRENGEFHRSAISNITLAMLVTLLQCQPMNYQTKFRILPEEQQGHLNGKLPYESGYFIN